SRERPVDTAVLMREGHAAAIFSKSMPARIGISAIGMPSTPITTAPCASCTRDINPSRTSLNISSPLDGDQPFLESLDHAPARVDLEGGGGSDRGGRLGRRGTLRGFPREDLGDSPAHPLVVGSRTGPVLGDRHRALS